MTDDKTVFGGQEAPKPSARSSAADLCALFIELLPMTGASISVFGVSGEQSTIFASDAVSTRLDEIQFDLGEGPRWEALRTGVAVTSPDIRVDDHSRWPIFGDAVQGLGALALYTFPVMMGAAMVGVVDLYRNWPGGMDPPATARAWSLARIVAGPAVILAADAAINDSASEARRMRGLRREVHQAVGMILVQLDTTATNALARLRAYAFATGRTVEAVAHDVVERSLDFTELSE